MSLNSFLQDWTEIMSIKQWRLENNIEVDQRYLDKVNKYVKVTEKFWLYATIFAFVIGLVIGVYV